MTANLYLDKTKTMAVVRFGTFLTFQMSLKAGTIIQV